MTKLHRAWILVWNTQLSLSHLEPVVGTLPQDRYKESIYVTPPIFRFGFSFYGLPLLA